MLSAVPDLILHDARPRCAWASDDLLYQAYHDTEWGVPVHDEHRLFEMLILEGAQAGLSWITVLRRREGYRTAFDHFDPVVVARYEAAKIEMLMQDVRIIRNRAKVRSAVGNAAAFLAVQAEFGTFDSYIWRFIGGAPKINDWATMADVPATTPESERMSADLKRRGFSFVGSTICYAFMQACGMVNDHVATCFLYPHRND